MLTLLFSITSMSQPAVGQGWDRGGAKWGQEDGAPRRWYTGTKCLNRRRAEDDRPETGEREIGDRTGKADDPEIFQSRSVLLRVISCCFVRFVVSSFNFSIRNHEITLKHTKQHERLFDTCHSCY